MTQNNFSPLNDPMIKEFSWVVTMVPGHVQHCHLAVTCPVTVATAKTIVIAGHLHIRLHKINFQVFVIKQVMKTTQIGYCGSFRCKFERHETYLPTLPQGWPRYELSYRGNLRKPVEFEIELTEK